MSTEVLHRELVAMLGTQELYELRRGGVVVAWIQSRPPYCDRGRYYACVEAPHWRSDAAPSPRYYFDLERGKAEIEAYCRAKQIDLAGAEWVRVK